MPKDDIPFLRDGGGITDTAGVSQAGAPVPEARFAVKMVRGVPVVTAPAEIDITNAEGLRSALLRAAAAGHGTFVVDMTRTVFCDSSGLHALVAAHRRARAEGREVLLVVPAVTVLRVFAITGMDQVIPNFATLDEALAQPPGRPGSVRRSTHCSP